MDDWNYAVSDLSCWLENRGVKTQYVQKRYVSFLQELGSFFVIVRQKTKKMSLFRRCSIKNLVCIFTKNKKKNFLFCRLKINSKFAP